MFSPMNSATELIDWYWSEIDTLKSSDTHHVLEDDGPCQCAIMFFIEYSSRIKFSSSKWSIL